MTSVGRVDDVITLASGEKTVPAPMEGIINSSPLLRGVVMFGRERNQVGVLVEPRAEYAIDTRDDSAVAAFRNQVWYVLPGFLPNQLPDIDRGIQGHLSRRQTRLHLHSVEYSKK